MQQQALRHHRFVLPFPLRGHLSGALVGTARDWTYSFLVRACCKSPQGLSEQKSGTKGLNHIWSETVISSNAARRCEKACTPKDAAILRASSTWPRELAASSRHRPSYRDTLSLEKLFVPYVTGIKGRDCLSPWPPELRRWQPLLFLTTK